MADILIQFKYRYDGKVITEYGNLPSFDIVTIRQGESYQIPSNVPSSLDKLWVWTVTDNPTLTRSATQTYNYSNITLNGQALPKQPGQYLTYNELSQYVSAQNMFGQYVLLVYADYTKATNHTITIPQYEEQDVIWTDDEKHTHFRSGETIVLTEHYNTSVESIQVLSPDSDNPFRLTTEDKNGSKKVDLLQYIGKYNNQLGQTIYDYLVDIRMLANELSTSASLRNLNILGKESGFSVQPSDNVTTSDITEAYNATMSGTEYVMSFKPKHKGSGPYTWKITASDGSVHWVQCSLSVLSGSTLTMTTTSELTDGVYVLKNDKQNTFYIDSSDNTIIVEDLNNINNRSRYIVSDIQQVGMVFSASIKVANEQKINSTNIYTLRVRNFSEELEIKIRLAYEAPQEEPDPIIPEPEPDSQVGTFRVAPNRFELVIGQSKQMTVYEVGDPGSASTSAEGWNRYPTGYQIGGYNNSVVDVQQNVNLAYRPYLITALAAGQTSISVTKNGVTDTAVVIVKKKTPTLRETALVYVNKSDFFGVSDDDDVEVESFSIVSGGTLVSNLAINPNDKRWITCTTGSTLGEFVVHVKTRETEKYYSVEGNITVEIREQPIQTDELKDYQFRVYIADENLNIYTPSKYPHERSDSLTETTFAGVLYNELYTSYASDINQYMRWVIEGNGKYKPGVYRVRRQTQSINNSYYNSNVTNNSKCVIYAPDHIEIAGTLVRVNYKVVSWMKTGNYIIDPIVIGFYNDPRTNSVASFMLSAPAQFVNNSTIVCKRNVATITSKMASGKITIDAMRSRIDNAGYEACADWIAMQEAAFDLASLQSEDDIAAMADVLGEPDEELDEQAIAPMSVDEENSEGDVTETPANEEISEQTETTEEEPIQE